MFTKAPLQQPSPVIKRQNIIDSDDDSLYNNAPSDLDIQQNSPMMMSEEEEEDANLASMGLPYSKTTSNLSNEEEPNEGDEFMEK